MSADVKALLLQKSKELHATVIAWRRHFHAHPELSFQEVKTSQFVYDTLCAFPGLEVSRPTETAVMAILCGDRPGKVIALRADMDALPLTEEAKVEYASQNPGVMHACGHDGHTAMLLGAAQILTDCRHLIAGEVRFIFQPGEEYGGAPSLLATGVLDGVDQALALHLWIPVASGKMGIVYGPAMATADAFTIRIIGKGGHGAMPHDTIDPIMIGTEIVSSLQTIITRKLNPLDVALLSVTKFAAGTNYNVIPDTAELQGTIRALDMQVLHDMKQLMRETVAGICQAHHAKYEITFVNDALEFPVLINDSQATKIVEETIVESFGADWCEYVRPTLGGEDFGYYAQRVPATMLFIGARTEAKGIEYPHHHPRFDIDEDALEYGVRVFVNFIRKTSMEV